MKYKCLASYENEMTALGKLDHCEVFTTQLTHVEILCKLELTFSD